MLIHRIVGGAVAVFGALLLGTLACLLFAPYAVTQPALDRIGVAGVLLGDMIGLAALMFGLWFAVAPAHAADHVRRFGDFHGD